MSAPRSAITWRDALGVCTASALLAVAFLALVYAPELVSWRRSWLP